MFRTVQGRKELFAALCILSVSLAPFAKATSGSTFSHVLGAVALVSVLAAAVLGARAVSKAVDSFVVVALLSAVAVGVVSGFFVLGLLGVPFAGLCLTAFLVSHSGLHRPRARRSTTKK